MAGCERFSSRDTAIARGNSVELSLLSCQSVIIDFMPRTPTKQLQRAWYCASIDDFLHADANAIIGVLVQRAPVATAAEEVFAWRREIMILQDSLQGWDGEVLLEFSIPRVGGRADAVLVSDSAIIVIEFKIGADTFTSAARSQVWDYALDLKNFHQASHELPIIPVVVATEAPETLDVLQRDPDGVYRPVRASPGRLRELIESVSRQTPRHVVAVSEWALAPYRPTPTIIEAARALYARHSVEEIARSDAGAQNLSVTTQCVEDIIAKAKGNGEKVVCFVTGVPGAGKTLVGLNIATQHRTLGADPAVFLSGNGPLVAVLRAALMRDERKRGGERRGMRHSAEIGTSVKSFIQNVHHFRDEALGDRRPPAEHVAIFDEAQRAWNQEQTERFMKRRKGLAEFRHSEPEFLLKYMDRHQDWAVVVCLVGGGQEIHTGEAGIGAWLAAVRDHLPHWRAVISERLTDAEYEGGSLPALVSGLADVRGDDRLHLGVSMRSFRAEHVSAFVKAVLDVDEPVGRKLLEQIRKRYPLALTRDLSTAKEWLRAHARGSERTGIVASSKAMRLKAFGLDVRVDVDPVHWFLHDREDVRSSYYLEDVATEFQIQGLEIDWACVTWDADLRRSGDGWSYHDFRGSRWTQVHAGQHRRYMLNAYRVLLTRARQGMIVLVPEGDIADHTRVPAFYDASYEYLRGLGLPVV